MVATNKLNVLQVKNARFEGKNCKLADGDGMYLCVNQSGRYWRFDYTFADKRKTISFGSADDVSLAEARTARTMARDWLAAYRHHVIESRAMARWVRINAFDTGMWRDDLEVVMAGAPDGVMLPKCEGPDQIRQLSADAKSFY